MVGVPRKTKASWRLVSLKASKASRLSEALPSLPKETPSAARLLVAPVPSKPEICRRRLVVSRTMKLPVRRPAASPIWESAAARVSLYAATKLSSLEARPERLLERVRLTVSATAVVPVMVKVRPLTTSLMRLLAFETATPLILKWALEPLSVAAKRLVLAPVGSSANVMGFSPAVFEVMER